MDVPFDNVTDEARNEWLEHPVTRAYLKTIKLMVRQMERSVIESACSYLGADPVKMAFLGGEIRGASAPYLVATKDFP